MTDDVLLAERAERWLATGLCCQPADRAAAESGVAAAYAAAGLPAPARVVWCDSPAAGAVAVARLRSGADPAGDPGASLRPRLRTGPWARARAALLAELGGGLPGTGPRPPGGRGSNWSTRS
jgi:hypothetical protein